MNLYSAVFYTDNLEEVVSFYRDVLGFEVDYIQDGRFASFLLGSGKLGIKYKKEEREVPGHQTVFIEVDDIKDLYGRIQEKKVTMGKELVEQDWATNFSILDPDGNKVQFLERNN